MELINKGIVYNSPDIPDQYDQSCSLEAIYSWGFTVITYCNVLGPIISFYDWEYQLILSLDHDEYTKYFISNNRLYVEQRYCFSDKIHEFSVNLGDGAPVHVSDIAAIGYVPDTSLSEDRRFYLLKDSTMYFKEDGHNLEIINSTLTDILKLGFKLLPEDCFDTNVDVLNNMICTEL
jgi:hypothetical protein